MALAQSPYIIHKEATYNEATYQDATNKEATNKETTYGPATDMFSDPSQSPLSKNLQRLFLLRNIVIAAQ